MAERKQRDIDQAMDPRLRPRVMTLQDARGELSNAAYLGTEVLEQLEGAGLIGTNAHHLRQEIAAFAVRLLELHWCGPSDPNKPS